MNSAWNVIRKLLREEEKLSKTVEPIIHKLKDSFYKNETQFKVYSIAPSSNSKIDFNKNNKKLILLNILFSSSGSAKYRIIKNGVVIATLFGGLNNNTFYKGELILKKNDDLTFEFTNMDRLAMDMYVGFDAKR